MHQRICLGCVESRENRKGHKTVEQDQYRVWKALSTWKQSKGNHSATQNNTIHSWTSDIPICLHILSSYMVFIFQYFSVKGISIWRPIKYMETNEIHKHFLLEKQNRINVLILTYRAYWYFICFQTCVFCSYLVQSISKVQQYSSILHQQYCHTNLNDYLWSLIMS